MAIHKGTQHSIESANLADLLERILDKGIVIAGDIKIKLVDIELLTLQIRLVICSVDKAREMGMDWWTNHAMFESRANQEAVTHSFNRLDERLTRLESALTPG
jgi:hypothetical protein